jgi:hypothetical protein
MSPLETLAGYIRVAVLNNVAQSSDLLRDTIANQVLADIKAKGEILVVKKED